MRETTRHRLAFNRYWALGPERTLPRLRAAVQAAGEHPPSLRTLEHWSSNHHWQSRIDDLERKARAAADDTRVAAIRAMDERQAQEALLMQRTGAEILAQVDPATASASDGVRALAEGARLERIACGAPTDRIANQNEPDPKLEELSDAELDRLIARAGEAVAGESAPDPD